MKKRIIQVLMFMVVFCMLLNGTDVSAATKTKVLKIKYSKITIYAGSSKQLSITENTTGYKPTYNSSNTTIATVTNQGSIKAKKAGKATISVKAGSKIAKCIVTVKTKVIEPKELIFKNDGYWVIDQGETDDIHVTVKPDNAKDKKVTYYSSNELIVYVDKTTGFITGRAEGTAYITAVASNGIKSVCEVDVTEYQYRDLEEKIPEEKDSTLYVRQGYVNIGQTVKQMQSTLGIQNRIDENEFGGQTYVYNCDYTSLIFVYVDNGLVVGYYTNAVTFNCGGVSYSSTSEDVKAISLGKAIWTVPDKYTIRIWYDSLGDGLPLGLFLTIPSIDQECDAESFLENPSSSLIHALESECLDLINGFRGREGINPVSLSEIVSNVARAHSEDMLKRGYASHISPEGINPGKRLFQAGVMYNGSAEILGACFPAGIIYDFTGFMNSTDHRNSVLDRNMIYAGPGIAYGNGLEEKGFITVQFYY